MAPCGRSRRSTRWPLPAGVGSATNRTNRPRRLLLFQYTAADAWPLKGITDYDRFKADLICGEESVMPRIVATPVRMPYPEAAHGGSIYENQKGTGSRYFATAERA